MSADGRVTIDTRLDSSGAVKGMQGLGKTLGKLGKLVAVAFSAKLLVDFGKQAVELASDIQEVQNVVDTAFGDMAYKMEQFAETAVDTYGISKLTAKQMASTYVAMARGMGQGLDLATDKSLEITGRLADVMSFYNKTQSEVDTIGRAIYSGETEPLKNIGVIMTETQLQAFALSKGYKTLYKDMSAADKLLIRQEYFLEQTNLAAGDFEKTQNSWANQTRILSEQWKEFLSILGTGLIQVLRPVVSVMNEILGHMITASTELMKFLGVDMTQGASTGVAALTDNMDAYTESVEAAGKAQEGSLQTFDKLNNVSSGSSGAGSSAASSTSPTITPTVDSKEMEEGEFTLESILETVKQRFSEFQAWTDQNFGGIWDSFIENTYIAGQNIWIAMEDIMMLLEPFKQYLVADFIPAFISVMNNLGVQFNTLFALWNTIFIDLWNIAIYPFIQNLLTILVPTITSISAELINTFTELFVTISNILTSIWEGGVVPALELLSTIFEDVMQSIFDFWNTYGVPIFDAINTSITKTGEVLMSLWNSVIEPVWQKIVAVLSELWSNHLKPLVDKIFGFVASLTQCALTIYNNFIAPIVSWLVDTLGPIVAWVFNNILDVIGPVVGAIVDCVSGIIDAISGILDFITGVFSGDWKKAWDGIVKAFKGIWDGLVAIVKAPINLIIGLVNVLIDSIETAINSLIGAVNKLSFTVPDWVPGIGGSKFGFSLKKVNFSSIPYLASGAVIPPNNEFLAVLGDQKHGTNIEAPLDTIKQALAEVLAQTGSQGGDIVINIDGREVFRAVRKQAREYTNRTGESAFSY